MNDDQVMHAMNIDDSYHVERVLARGVGGVTELVTLDGTGPFVRKRIPFKLARRAVWATLPEIDCRRLPHIEATYEMPDAFVVVYDYVPGETLEEMVNSRGPFTAESACRLVCEVCEAASALHEHGILHRDITPSNVIVAADGAHLIDFGIARIGAEGKSRDTTQLGTWGFAAPEQFGFAQTDVRSEVYSIGQLLGYLVTGIHPENKDAYEKALEDPAVTPPLLHDIVAQATAFEPSARFQSASALAHAIQASASGTTPTLTQTAAPAAAAARPAPAAAPAAGPQPFSEGASAAGPQPSQDSTPDAAPYAASSQREKQQEASEQRPSAGDSRGGRKGHPVRNVLIAVVVLLALFLVLYTIWDIEVTKADRSSRATSTATQTQAASASSTSSAASAASTEGGGAHQSASDQEGGVPLDGLSITETFWQVDSGSSGTYIEFCYALTNESSVTYVDPKVTVTGFADDGSVVGTDDGTPGTIAPGQTIYCWRRCSASSTPARVDFSLTAWSLTEALDSEVPPSFSVSNTSLSESGPQKLNGLLTRDDAGSFTRKTEGVYVSIVFRDASGAIVGGNSELQQAPALGESIPFDVYVGNVGEYASYDIYVWYD